MSHKMKDKQNNVITEGEEREVDETEDCALEEDDFFQEDKESFLQPSSSRFTLRKRKRRGEL